MERRTRYWAGVEKRDAVEKADDAGLVADSMEVRAALIKRMDAGELTLAEVQAELKRIKRNASRNGLSTRSKVWNQS